jgi:hypothetical protein
MKAVNVLVSLALVLGLAASASAGEVYWNGKSAGLNWSDDANWINGKPTADDLAYLGGAGSGSPTHGPTVTTTEVADRLFYWSIGSDYTLTIASSGSLTADAQHFQVMGSGGHFTANIAGVLNSQYFQVDLTDCTLNLTGSGSYTVENSDGGSSYMAGSNNSIVIGSTSAQFKWAGSHTTHDIFTNHVSAGVGLTLVIDETTNPGYTTAYATPEPATVAILGLGSLVLLRRRR